VGTEYGGLYGVRGDTVRHYAASADGPPHDRVTAVAEAEDGTLWVGAGARYEPDVGGLAARDPTTGRFALFRQGLPHAHVTAVLEDRTGALWVGTEAGLAVLDRTSGRISTYRNDPLDVYSLVNDRIYAIYEDRAGIVWIATDGGVSRYVREKNRFALHRHDPFDANSLGAERVGAVLKDRDGVLWVGLHASGLDRIDPVSGTVSHYRHDPNDPHSLSHDHVTALCQDRDGAVWVGTDRGLDRLDPATGRFAHFVHNPADPHSLGPGAVKVIVEDRSGALWIGTEEPGTLSRLDPAREAFTVYRYESGSLGGFPDTYGVRAILEDREGRLWIGTYNGLLCLDRQRGTFTQYRHDPLDPTSLSDDFVWALHEADNGALWVGTHGGLNRLERESGRFTVYTVEDGLPNDGIAAILGDGSGALWLATMGGGLSRFDPASGTFRNFDTSDGLQGMHFIIGAACASADGELFFGGARGLNRFYPAEIRDNPHVPAIVLTAFRVFDQTVDFGRDLAEVRAITLSHRENFFSFEFAALDYAAPAKNEYAYRLEGFDRDWVNAGTRRYAAYTNVPPGAYIFRVRGSNNDGIWNEEGLALRVVITPPFWATWWFRLLGAVVVAGVASGVYLVRARSIAALREREERFRTLFENAPLGVFEVDLSQSPPRIMRANREAVRIYGEAVASAERLSLDQLVADAARSDLDRLLEGLPRGEAVTVETTHRRQDGSEFPARVSAAVGPTTRRGQAAIVIVEDITAERAWHSEQEAIAEERRRIAREIHDGLAQDLAALRMRARLWHALLDEAPGQLHAEFDALRDLLSRDIREVRRAIFALRPVALDELGFWPALRGFLDEFGEQNGLHVHLRINGAEDNLPSASEPVLFRITQEALHNVAKHAQASNVWVELDLEQPDVVQLTVRDDGVGFDPALLEQAARSGHIGLKQMRERVAGLRGRFALHSAPGQGTEIRVALSRAQTR